MPGVVERVDPAEQEDSFRRRIFRWSALRRSPFRLCLLTGIAMFLSEVAVHSWWVGSGIGLGPLSDAALAVFLLYPILYLLLFRPMNHSLKELGRAERSLLLARDQLEDRVAERTSELAVASDQLRREVEERRGAEAALRESRESLRELSAALMEAQEQERARISRELHDGVGQLLTGLRLYLERIPEPEEGPEHLKQCATVEKALLLVDRTMDDVRRICMGLRPTTLDDLGLVATLQWFCRNLDEIYPATSIQLELGVVESEIPEPLKTPIFRILQEAVGNAAKHSGAAEVRVTLTRSGDVLELLVADAGKGFDPANGRSTRQGRVGFGLGTMRERAERSGGELTISSAAGGGTTVRAQWLLQRQIAVNG